ncbi:MAG TPA: RidA family protein [Bacillales bacterium]|nr:RidA family protein [Bacillales bacterium]
MIKRIVSPPYDSFDLSTLVIHNDTVYIGHFGGAGETAAEQLAHTLEKLRAELQKINLGLDKVVKLTIMLKNIEDFHSTHEIWTRYFTKRNYPVRATMTTDFIDENCLVQIEGVACY